MSLVRRSVTSSVYNIAANVIGLAVGFVGSIALARLLKPEAFGVFAFVASVVQLTVRCSSSRGAPERVIRARIIQLAVMVAGLFTLGPGLGIAGVAQAQLFGGGHVQSLLLLTMARGKRRAGWRG